MSDDIIMHSTTQ